MRVVSTCTVWFFLLLPPVVSSPCRADETTPADAADVDEQESKKPAPAITISKETTRITGPLDEEGYVDYLAALNEQGSRGVTPENNAVVLLWRAMGPPHISEVQDYYELLGISVPEKPEELIRRYFRLLGIPPLPAEGDYFVRFDDFLARRGIESSPETYDEFDRAGKRAWSRRECPLVAEWLEANEKPLALIMESSRRPRHYCPLVAEEGHVSQIVWAYPWTIGRYRRVARALLRRAMLRRHEGELEEAWEDLLACRRLGRLLGQGPRLLDGLMAFTIDGLALAGNVALVLSEKLTAKQAAEFQADLEELPPLPDLLEKFDRGERFKYLDTATSIARYGRRAIRGLLGSEGSRTSQTRKTLTQWVTNSPVDWDDVLRIGNSYYDRVLQACRDLAHPQRESVLESIEKKLRIRAGELKDPKSIAQFLLAVKSARAMPNERVAAILARLLMPEMSVAVGVESRAAARIRETHLALALARYHSDHGAYPPALKELTPKYIEKLPPDPFAGGPFRYRRQGKGYLLYSVGSNRKDDGGRNKWLDFAAEDDPDYEGDDIGIRTPRGRGG